MDYHFDSRHFRAPISPPAIFTSSKRETSNDFFLAREIEKFSKVFARRFRRNKREGGRSFFVRRLDESRPFRRNLPSRGNHDSQLASTGFVPLRKLTVNPLPRRRNKKGSFNFPSRAREGRGGRRKRGGNRHVGPFPRGKVLPPPCYKLFISFVFPVAE